MLVVDSHPVGASVFELTVTDDSGNESSPAQAQVIVRDNVAPTAVLDVPFPVNIGEAFTLDGSRSADIGGSISTYEWRKVSGPAYGGPLDTGVIKTQSAMLVVDSHPVGISVFELTVTDDSGNESLPAQAQVIVRDNVAPTAVITAPSVVASGNGFTLDGSLSSDLGGSISRYTWSKLSGAANGGPLDAGPVQLATPTLPQDPYPAGPLIFQLVVEDDSGNVSLPAQVSVTILDTAGLILRMEPLANGDLQVVWSTVPSNLNLYTSRTLGRLAVWQTVITSPIKVGNELRATIGASMASGFFAVGSAAPTGAPR
jgi:hypothetical protein